MRELQLAEIENVSGGQVGPEPDDNGRYPTVTVTGTRVGGMSAWEIDNLINNLQGQLGGGLSAISNNIAAGLAGYGAAAQEVVDQANEIEANCPGAVQDFNEALDDFLTHENLTEFLLTHESDGGLDEFNPLVDSLDDFDNGMFWGSYLNFVEARFAMYAAQEHAESCTNSSNGN